MAYTYSPVELEPFSHSRATAPKYDSYESGYNIQGQGYVPNLNQWNQDQNQAQQDAYQTYSQDQFKNLFDSINNMGMGFSSDQANEERALQAQQNAIARQAFQASLPQAPQMNFQQSPQPIYTGGGWGQQSPMMSSTPMTYRNQAPSGMLGTTNRGSHGGILGGSE
jgi:hypothetical protein